MALHQTSDSSALLNAVLQASDDAVFTKTLTGHISSWSRGAQNIYGYAPEEIIGRNVTDLMPEGRKHEAAMLLGRLASGITTLDFDTERVTRDGRILVLNLSITPIRERDGSIIGGLTIARNSTHLPAMMSAARRLSEREREHLLVLNAAQTVARDILTTEAGTEALKHIADAGRSLTGARYAAIGVARTDGVPGLQQFITVGLTDADEARIGARPRGVGILGLLLERTEPLRIDSLDEHARSGGFPANHPPMTSFLGVPIRSANAVLGSLYLTEKIGGGPFTEADEVAVAALGAHAAVAIHNLLMLSRQRALVSGLIMAQEEERRAVAYDLHDGLTQYVMAAHAHLDAFKKAHTAGNESRASGELETGMKYLKEAVVESRRLVNGLRTLALDDLGLAGALEQAVEEEGRRAGWTDTNFVHNISGRRFDASVETSAYRIAQEALSNARKHAQTKRVRVTALLEEPGDGVDARRLRLEVRDWGRGFDIEQVGNDDSRVGLHSMHERVRILGGEWLMTSMPGIGTTVRALLPLPVEPDSAANEQNGAEEMGGEKSDVRN